MLSLITIQEHPDLEQKRNEIIVSCAEMKQSLQKIEDKILHSLTESEGSVISIDLMQVNTVEDSKVKSEEIKVENYIKYLIITGLIKSNGKMICFYFSNV